MSKRKRAIYERRFGAPLEDWAAAQMLEALKELLPERGRAGRPKKTDLLVPEIYAAENYAALAFQVEELIASPQGAKLNRKAATRKVILDSLEDRKAEQRMRDEDVRRAEEDGNLEHARWLRDLTPVPVVDRRELTAEFFDTALRGVRTARKR